MFLTNSRFQKRFPGAKKGKIRQSAPRPEWRNPVQFQIKYPEWTLCHGFSKTSITGSTAWLEKDDIVLLLADVPQNVYFGFALYWLTPAEMMLLQAYQVPKKTFYKIHGISGVRRFTKESCRKQLNTWRTYGPWKEIA